jgi:hypothetical protein
MQLSKYGDNEMRIKILIEILMERDRFENAEKLGDNIQMHLRGKQNVWM